jgi:hypothetical protein
MKSKFGLLWIALDGNIGFINVNLKLVLRPKIFVFSDFKVLNTGKK